MITYKSRKEVFETDGVAIFSYSLNQRAVKMFEFGAFFLLIVAMLIAFITHFEPRQWMAAALALSLAATAAFCTAKYWRTFATTEFVGWDQDNFYVTQGRKGVAVIPWNVLDLNNTGLKDPTAGSVLNIHISPDDPIIKLRLVAGFIIVQKFQTVLATILTHIKQNMERNGTLKPKEADAEEAGVSTGTETSEKAETNAATPSEADSVTEKETDDKASADKKADDAVSSSASESQEQAST